MTQTKWAPSFSKQKSKKEQIKEKKKIKDMSKSEDHSKSIQIEKTPTLTADKISEVVIIKKAWKTLVKLELEKNIDQTVLKRNDTRTENKVKK